MSQLPNALTEEIKLLGELLGDTLLKHEKPKIFNKIEDIRKLGRTLEEGEAPDAQSLFATLTQLEDEEVLPIARAFNQFLNLSNIVEQEFGASGFANEVDHLDRVLQEHVESLGKDALAETLEKIKIELVLTAHPTEVTRRTLIQKYDHVADCLAGIKRTDLLPHETSEYHADLKRVIEEIWTTDEIRNERPTAVDEARWGISVIESSLWKAVPNFLRHFDQVARKRVGQGLPIDAAPFVLYSWMGGDRDGNPNVTTAVTERVILSGRWTAAVLYLQEIKQLSTALSMHAASSELLEQLSGSTPTPYREILKPLIILLENTHQWTDAKLRGREQHVAANILLTQRCQLLEKLELCHRSLCQVGLEDIANGPLIDIIRRINCFGINLAPLDIRQDGERHVQAIDEVCQYLGLGSYLEWNEPQRQAFLLEQLSCKRPLLPRDWPHSEDTREVLNTCRILTEQPKECISHYIISMAQQPSDVLVVALLLRESGMQWSMPIVPLFETLDDLDRAPEVMKQLWQLDWYQTYSARQQTVMIGYSDSAKDAGKLAATWAQYKAQEKLVSIAESNAVQLVLFHGRGGSVGRGGGPVEKAMTSQPPGSVKGVIRVTEQGEMIRYKFGRPRVAFKSLSTYVVANLNATLAPAAPPCEAWRTLIETMSNLSLDAYRSVVRGNDQFVAYFRSLTPEQELSKLAIGSRPAKRRASGGVESLRAIPWVFAWTQVRLNLPAWLGTRQALEYAKKRHPDLLQDMLANWPFFSSFVDLLEMVLGKSDLQVCEHYESQLVEDEVRPLGQQLRSDLSQLIELLLEIRNQDSLLDHDPVLQDTLRLRKPYIDPLNYFQVELLKRERRSGGMSADLERALQVTMAGISAGMRNTG